MSLYLTGLRTRRADFLHVLRLVKRVLWATCQHVYGSFRLVWKVFKLLEGAFQFSFHLIHGTRLIQRCVNYGNVLGRMARAHQEPMYGFGPRFKVPLYSSVSLPEESAIFLLKSAISFAAPLWTSIHIPLYTFMPICLCLGHGRGTS
jgi:hypothetical protein